jgi:DNA repair protein SbcD/Mre11
MTLDLPKPRRLRLAHCSDVHLDGDHRPPEHYRREFARLLRSIRRDSPDLLLIAGDLFDANDASDETVLWSMEQLGALPFRVAMIPGNHDCVDGRGIYQRSDFERVGNVDMFISPEGEIRRFHELGLAIWGKGMVDHSPEHRPLAGCPAPPPQCDWYLGMAHGIYVPAGASTGRSSQIAHEEIEGSPCDYLALGHHHAALEIRTERTLAAFCGSPTDLVGGGATYATVELVPGEGAQATIRVLDEER